nr:MAG TPA: hypothetical protein [Caudoviricetes sp.]
MIVNAGFTIKRAEDFTPRLFAYCNLINTFSSVQTLAVYSNSTD